MAPQRWGGGEENQEEAWRIGLEERGSWRLRWAGHQHQELCFLPSGGEAVPIQVEAHIHLKRIKKILYTNEFLFNALDTISL